MTDESEVRVVGQYGVAENVSDTSSCIPPDGYDSWIAFWVAKTGCERPFVCQNDLCNHAGEGQDIVGAHIRFMFEEDVWIAPLCRACNSEKDSGLLLLPRGLKVVRNP